MTKLPRQLVFDGYDINDLHKARVATLAKKITGDGDTVNVRQDIGKALAHRYNVHEELVTALKNLIDQAQEDCPVEYRTKHFDTAVESAFEAYNEAIGIKQNTDNIPTRKLASTMPPGFHRRQAIKTVSPEMYIKRFTRIYDNGGKSFDRYTCVFMDKPQRATVGTLVHPLHEALGFSDDPFSPVGFAMHVSAAPGRHLGKRIAFDALNSECQQFIKQNL